MGLTITDRGVVTQQLALEYRRVRKKERGRILDSLVELTQYNRCYATRILRQRPTAHVLGQGTVGARWP
jgi:hypothetical protein